MSSRPSTGLSTLLGAGAVADADRPLLTYLDDATGERVDLTASELGHWAARTAALLHDGCELLAGDRIAVLLPPHWQTAAIMLGAWSIGVTVSYRGWATAGLTPCGTGADEPLEAVFVSRQRVRSWLDVVPEGRHRFVLGLDPHGAPMAVDEMPDGYRDYLAEVGRYPDSGVAPQLVRRNDPASPDGTSYGQWGEIARTIAERLELRPGDRMLVGTAEHEQPVTWLLASLAAGASVVLCANADRSRLDDRIAAEGITHVL